MAINFPSTAGQATDGSYTYTVAGITYAWNGSSWAAAGAGASATDRTLFSVTQNAVGTAALSYTSATGVFSYTPPDLSSYLTAEADTLTTVTGRGSATTNSITVGGLTVDGAGDTVGKLDITDQGSYSQIQFYNNTGVAKVALKGVADNLYIEGGAGNIRLHTYALFYTNGDVTLNNSGNGNTTIGGSLTAGGLTYPTTNGTSGDVLTSDGAGNVSWSTPSGLQTRTTAQVTVSATQDVDVNTQITTPNGYALLAIGTSHAAWVTLYMDTNSRTLDAGRGETSDPVPGSGVLAEIITTGSTTQYITPGAFCFNTASNNTTYIKAVGKAAGTVNLTITLTYIQLEG
jgi:hypothetical protein